VGEAKGKLWECGHWGGSSMGERETGPLSHHGFVAVDDTAAPLLLLRPGPLPRDTRGRREHLIALRQFGLRLAVVRVVQVPVLRQLFPGPVGGVEPQLPRRVK
jgi:hypothetical protein